MQDPGFASAVGHEEEQSEVCNLLEPSTNRGAQSLTWEEEYRERNRKWEVSCREVNQYVSDKPLQHTWIEGCRSLPRRQYRSFAEYFEEVKLLFGGLVTEYRVVAFHLAAALLLESPVHQEEGDDRSLNDLLREVSDYGRWRLDVILDRTQIYFVPFAAFMPVFRDFLIEQYFTILRTEEWLPKAGAAVICRGFRVS